MVKLKDTTSKKQTSIGEFINSTDNSDEIIENFDFGGWTWKPKYAIFLKTEEHREAGEWCKKNCEKKWYNYMNNFWFFEDVNDAMSFKLRW